MQAVRGLSPESKYSGYFGCIFIMQVKDQKSMVFFLQEVSLMVNLIHLQVLLLGIIVNEYGMLG